MTTNIGLLSSLESQFEITHAEIFVFLSNSQTNRIMNKLFPFLSDRSRTNLAFQCNNDLKSGITLAWEYSN